MNPKVNERNRLCLALDVPTLRAAEEVVSELAGLVGLFKVGMQLFTAEGPRAIERIQALGGSVFLDLKYHDIPNTVANAAREAKKLGVEMFTIHASGGSRMMRSVVEAIEEPGQEHRPLVMAITVLTSLSTRQLRDELNMKGTVIQQARTLAQLAKACGVNGVVASPQEIRTIRRACGPKLIILTPGIRPAWAAAKGDQERVMTPAEAIRFGADYVVVGRPILAAKNRLRACRRVLDEMGRADADA